MRVDTSNTVLNIASALLLQRKEVPLEEIKAIPFFNYQEDPEAVISFLIKKFKAEIYVKKVSSKPILEWQEIIRLKE